MTGLKTKKRAKRNRKPFIVQFKDSSSVAHFTEWTKQSCADSQHSLYTAIRVAARIAPSSRRAAAEKDRTDESVFYIKRADSADSLAGNA